MTFQELIVSGYIKHIGYDDGLAIYKASTGFAIGIEGLGLVSYFERYNGVGKAEWVYLESGQDMYGLGKSYEVYEVTMTKIV